MIVDGFNIGDTIRLLDGQTYIIVQFLRMAGNNDYWFIGRHPIMGYTEKFKREDIERLIERESLVMDYECVKCNETKKIFKNQIYYYNSRGCCPECYLLQEEREQEKWFDSDGYQKKIKIKQLFRKED